jgi:ActD protein
MAGNTAVFGIYSSRLDAENAIDLLKESGYRNSDISALFAQNQGTKGVAVEKETKAPEGITAGAGSGAVIGGALGWLAGIGALAIPGVGPFIAAGPIIAMLSGAGVGGAVGGVAGGLIGAGMPEYEAKRYEGRMKSGGILLSVHCDDSNYAKRAKAILEETGAEDISSMGEPSADFSKSDEPKRRSAGDY